MFSMKCVMVKNHKGYTLQVLSSTPCIMCVQYIRGMFSISGGVQYTGDTMSTSGGYHEYIGGIS